ncbi:MAG: hypothetical protein AAF211_10055 [Myxococcota bacterium]
MVWWALSLAFAGDCDRPTTFPALSQTLLDGERAVRDSDRDALETAETRAEQQLKCLGSSLRPADVAGFMRLKGIALFVRKDRDRADAWFSAARSVDPTYSLPEALIPERHPLRRAFENAAPPDEVVIRVPAPSEGTIAVNGRSTRDLPTQRPWVLQWQDNDGNVELTRFGEDAPESWPYPLRYERGRWHVVLAAAGQLAPSSEPGDLRAGLVASSLIELGGPGAFDLGVRALVAPVSTDAGTEGRLVPGVHAGVRGWFRIRDVPTFAGLAALLTSHDDPVVAPGGLLKAGVRLGQRREFAELALEGGFSREPFVMISAGYGFGR